MKQVKVAGYDLEQMELSADIQLDGYLHFDKYLVVVEEKSVYVGEVKAVADNGVYIPTYIGYVHELAYETAAAAYEAAKLPFHEVLLVAAEQDAREDESRLAHII